MNFLNIVILFLSILFIISCQSKEGQLVQGDAAYTDVKMFGGIISVTSLDEDEMKVCWHPIPGAKEYRIFMGKPGNCGTNVDYIDIVTDPALDCKVVTLQNKKPGSTFTISVRACDKYSNPDLNVSTLDVTMLDLTPPNFSGLTSATQTLKAREMKLEWKAATGDPERYEIYLCKEDPYQPIDDGFCPDDISLLPEAQRQEQFDKDYKPYTFIKKVNDPSLISNGQNVTLYLGEQDGVGDDLLYHVLVRACDKANNCDANNIIKTARPSGSNFPPIFNGITSVSYNNSNLIMEWVEPQGQTSQFRIFVSAPNGEINYSGSYVPFTYTDFIKHIIDPSNSTKYPAVYPLKMSISQPTLLKVGVRACDYASRCDSNIIYKEITISDNQPPIFGGITSARAIDDYRVELNFTSAQDTPDFMYYAIYKFGTCSNLVFSDANLFDKITDITATSYENDPAIMGKDLTPGAQNAWVIKAVDSSNNMSVAMNECKVVIQQDNIPPIFYGIASAETSTDGFTTSATITFSEAIDDSPLAYKIYRAKSKTGNISPLTPESLFIDGNILGNVTLTKSGSTYIFIDKNLDGDTYYDYGVRACDIPADRRPGNCETNTVFISKYVRDITPPTIYTAPSDFYYKLEGAAPNEVLKIYFTPSPDADLEYYQFHEIIEREPGFPDLERDIPVLKDAAIPNASGKASFVAISGTQQFSDGYHYRYNIVGVDTSGNISRTANTFIEYKRPDTKPPEVGIITNFSVPQPSPYYYNITVDSASDISGIWKWYVYMRTETGSYNFNEKICSSFASNKCRVYSEPSSSTKSFSNKTLNFTVETASLPIGSKYYFLVLAQDNPENSGNTNNLGNNPDPTNKIVITGKEKLIEIPDYIPPFVKDLAYIPPANSEFVDISFNVDEANTLAQNMKIKVYRKLGVFGTYENFIDVFSNDPQVKSPTCSTPGAYCINVENTFKGTDWTTPVYVKIEAIDGASLSHSAVVAVQQVMFNGWINLQALGQDDGNDPKIALKWEPMGTPKYNIYKSLKKGSLGDLWNTTGEINDMGANGTSFSKYIPAKEAGVTDDNKMGNTFYFKIIPVPASGQEIRTLPAEIDDQIEVTIPPKNMALVHRWIVNRDMCKSMGKLGTVDRKNNYACKYTGPTNHNEVFDIGAHHFIDRWETSLDASNKPTNARGGMPFVNLSQSQAQSNCYDRVVTGGDATIRLSLPGRILFIAASSWDEDFLADINTKFSESANEMEAGKVVTVKISGSDVYSNPCNSNKSTFVSTGASSTSNCISKYGVQDLIGNVWEWGNDFLTAQTVGANFISKGLFGISLETQSTATTFANYPNLLFPLGLPQIDPPTYPDGSQSTSSIPSKDDYYAIGTVVGTTYAILQGGAFNTGTGSGRLAIDATRIPTETFASGSAYYNKVGYRCAVKLADHPIWKHASANDRSVTLQWGNTAYGGTVQEYEILRSMVDGDVGIPVCTLKENCPRTPSFTDNDPTIIPSTIYYYSVVPILDGDNKVEVLAPDWQIQVKTTPLDSTYQMVHRWTYNRKLCDGELITKDNTYVSRYVEFLKINGSYTYTCLYPPSAYLKYLGHFPHITGASNFWDEYFRLFPSSTGSYTIANINTMDLNTIFMYDGTINKYIDIGGENGNDFYIARVVSRSSKTVPEILYDESTSNPYKSDGLAFNIDDGHLLFWSKTSKIAAPYGKANHIKFGPNYTKTLNQKELDASIGHWYKAGQWNIHMIDQYFSPLMLADPTRHYKDVTYYNRCRAPNGIYNDGRGQYGSFCYMAFTGWTPPDTFPIQPPGDYSWYLMSESGGSGNFNVPVYPVASLPANWGNINMDNSNICFQSGLRLPRKSETTAGDGALGMSGAYWNGGTYSFTSDPCDCAGNTGTCFWYIYDQSDKGSTGCMSASGQTMRPVCVIP